MDVLKHVLNIPEGSWHCILQDSVDVDKTLCLSCCWLQCFNCNFVCAVGTQSNAVRPQVVIRYQGPNHEILCHMHKAPIVQWINALQAYQLVWDSISISEMLLIRWQKWCSFAHCLVFLCVLKTETHIGRICKQFLNLLTVINSK